VQRIGSQAEAFGEEMKRRILQVCMAIGGLLMLFRFGGPALIFGATGPGPFGTFRADGCPFCRIPKEHILQENELAFAIREAAPVTPLHTLMIPKRAL
jgi:hypothetical protein